MARRPDGSYEFGQYDMSNPQWQIREQERKRKEQEAAQQRLMQEQRQREEEQRKRREESSRHLAAEMARKREAEIVAEKFRRQREQEAAAIEIEQARKAASDRASWTAPSNSYQETIDVRSSVSQTRNDSAASKTILFDCTSCKQELRASEDRMGQIAKCPKCGKKGRLARRS